MRWRSWPGLLWRSVAAIAAQPVAEHVQRLIDEDPCILLLGRAVADPIGEDAEVERPIELQGHGRDFSVTVLGGNRLDAAEVQLAQDFDVVEAIGKSQRR